MNYNTATSILLNGEIEKTSERERLIVQHDANSELASERQSERSIQTETSDLEVCEFHVNLYVHHTHLCAHRRINHPNVCMCACVQRSVRVSSHLQVCALTHTHTHTPSSSHLLFICLVLLIHVQIPSSVLARVTIDFWYPSARLTDCLSSL